MMPLIKILFMSLYGEIFGNARNLLFVLLCVHICSCYISVDLKTRYIDGPEQVNVYEIMSSQESGSRIRLWSQESSTPFIDIIWSVWSEHSRVEEAHQLSVNTTLGLVGTGCPNVVFDSCPDGVDSYVTMKLIGSHISGSWPMGICATGGWNRYYFVTSSSADRPFLKVGGMKYYEGDVVASGTTWSLKINSIRLKEKHYYLFNDSNGTLKGKWLLFPDGSATYSFMSVKAWGELYCDTATAKISLDISSRPEHGYLNVYNELPESIEQIDASAIVTMTLTKTSLVTRTEFEQPSCSFSELSCTINCRCYAKANCDYGIASLCHRLPTDQNSTHCYRLEIMNSEASVLAQTSTCHQEIFENPDGSIVRFKAVNETEKLTAHIGYSYRNWEHFIFVGTSFAVIIIIFALMALSIMYGVICCFRHKACKKAPCCRGKCCKNARKDAGEWEPMFLPRMDNILRDESS